MYPIYTASIIFYVHIMCYYFQNTIFIFKLCRMYVLYSSSKISLLSRQMTIQICPHGLYFKKKVVPIHNFFKNKNVFDFKIQHNCVLTKLFGYCWLFCVTICHFLNDECDNLHHICSLSGFFLQNQNQVTIFRPNITVDAIRFLEINVSVKMIAFKEVGWFTGNIIYYYLEYQDGLDSAKFRDRLSSHLRGWPWTIRKAVFYYYTAAMYVPISNIIIYIAITLTPPNRTIIEQLYNWR